MSAIQLPSGYTALEYIESTEDQYIDTGFTPDNNTRLVIDCEITKATSAFQGIACARDSSYTHTFTLYATSTNGRYRSDFGTSTSNRIEFSETFDRHVFDKDRNVLKVDGVTKVTHTNETFTAPVTMVLFTGRNSNTIANPANMRLYSCQLYDNDVMVRNFYPALRDSDGEIGLYDTTNNKFYENKGTGKFLVGSPSVNGTAVVTLEQLKLLMDNTKSGSSPLYDAALIFRGYAQNTGSSGTTYAVALSDGITTSVSSTIFTATFSKPGLYSIKRNVLSDDGGVTLTSRYIKFPTDTSTTTFLYGFDDFVFYVPSANSKLTYSLVGRNDNPSWSGYRYYTEEFLIYRIGDEATPYINGGVYSALSSSNYWSQYTYLGPSYGITCTESAKNGLATQTITFQETGLYEFEYVESGNASTMSVYTIKFGSNTGNLSAHSIIPVNDLSKKLVVSVQVWSNTTNTSKTVYYKLKKIA